MQSRTGGTNPPGSSPRTRRRRDPVIVEEDLLTTVNHASDVHEVELTQLLIDAAADEAPES